MPQFVKGQSGNPGGRPKDDAVLKELCRAKTVDAVKVLAEIMRGKKSPAAARVAAATALLDRGYGKPAQSIIGDPENPLHTVTKIVREIVDSPSSKDA